VHRGTFVAHGGDVGKASSSSSSFLIFADCPYPLNVRSNLDFLREKENSIT